MDRPPMTGVFVPHVTPLDDDGAVDEASLERLVDYLCAADLGGLVSCARVGEGPVLSWEEKRRVVEVVAEETPADLPLVATVAPATTAEAVERINEAADAGADAAMIIPPLLFAWGQSSPEMRFRF
ncbi:MAG: dihydrodipicolinate synthase family protein, partial [Halobacteriales archaeon]|nr:dihydrodipicolinate synthase family protein [Halobacteriales archaeon]